ncbi:MAG TPA: glutathione S-transferase family protein [Candidatus Binatia bacterium]|jgi:glutathione S-transferase
MSDLVLVIGNYNLSSWSLRPWLLLRYFEVPFETLRIELEVPDDKPPHVKAAIRAKSPSGRVPALQHCELTVWDSLAIAEYVSELFPDRQMWPADRSARALARAVSAEMHSGFSDLRHTMWMNLTARVKLGGVSKAVGDDVRRVQQIWTDCRTRFGHGGPFLFGRFSIADAMYAPVVSRFTTYGVETGDVGRRYMDAIWQVPAMQQWLDEAQREVAAT